MSDVKINKPKKDDAISWEGESMKKHSVAIFIIGLLLGLTIMSIIWGINSSGEECYPMSRGNQQSFHFLEIENCLLEDRDTCWIEENQYEKLQSVFARDHYVGSKLSNGKIFIMRYSK